MGKNHTQLNKSFLDSSYFDANFKDFIDSLNGKQRYLQRRKSKIFKNEDVFRIEDLKHTTDPVRLYLREMGNTPLLTQTGELVKGRKLMKLLNPLMKEKPQF